MSEFTRQDMISYGRFGYMPGKFRGCRFCHGRGCPSCDDQAKQQFPAFKQQEDAEYKRQFPNGPECVTIPLERLGEAKAAIGADALLAAFSEGGGGVKQVFDNLERLGFGRPQPLDNVKESESDE